MQVIDEVRQTFPVKQICSELGVSRSSYYRWKTAPEKQTSPALLETVRALHAQSRRSYGSRRMAQALRRHGLNVGRYRARTLMREAEITVRYARPRYRRADTASTVAPNRLDRQFQPDACNRVWVGDMTYVATTRGWAYVAIVLDLFARRIIGWACSMRPDTELVLTALERAWQARGKPAGVMFHSDQGVQYTSARFTAFLHEHSIVQSMSRRGNCWDNAAMERLIRSVKEEGLRDRSHQTVHDVDRDLCNYAAFYNAERLHSAIGYLTPIEAERAGARMVGQVSRKA